jgi:uncharacterized lipoprotein YddW (UPF0748 family)
MYTRRTVLALGIIAACLLYSCTPKKAASGSTEIIEIVEEKEVELIEVPVEIKHPAESPVEEAPPPVIDIEEIKIPGAPREFRAAWVATVANINWPSKPGLSTAQQQKEALELLDFLQKHNFNAVVFQVRPQADAFYESSLEPWSYFLTGVQGKAPNPYYDPLEFWIQEAHKRGLELHVWLNPYRAHHISGGPVSDKSVVKTKSDLVVHLKQGYWWFDPSRKETQDHGVNVIMDIVKRYEIDGVHFDDYFYPYAVYNNNEDFPDSLSWNQYVASGGKLSRSDWRRKAVNDFIKRVYDEIKKEKKHVKFGLSPFGIWKPGYPEAIVSGFNQYEELYADAKLWLNEGWIDYFSPQLYWPIVRVGQSFPVLLGWWASENTKKRHLWPGISVGRDTARAVVNETIGQIMISRGMLPESPGVIHWSISSDTKNPALQKSLLEGPYKKPALIPASPWLDNEAPEAPALAYSEQGDKIKIQWTHTHPNDVFKWVVYYRYGNTWDYQILNAPVRTLELKTTEENKTINAIAVSAVDRTGNESKKTTAFPDIVKIVPRKEWNAADPRPFKQHTPVRITVHHEGGRVLKVTDDAGQRLKAIQTWSMGPDRNWTDIPYHYLIAPDGTVYEGRNPLTVGETNTEYDPTGHLLISFLGNYNEMEMNAHLEDVLTRLIAHFCIKYNISPDTIATHRDHSSMTNCPGKNLYPYFESGQIKEKVKELLKLAQK